MDEGGILFFVFRTNTWYNNRCVVIIIFMFYNGIGLGVSATLLEHSILAQTIWWHYAKPVLSDSSFIVGGQET
jgi:hypothetical protein